MGVNISFSKQFITSLSSKLKKKWDRKGERENYAVKNESKFKRKFL